jgi:hypothetical protein
MRYNQGTSFGKIKINHINTLKLLNEKLYKPEKLLDKPKIFLHISAGKYFF